MRNPYEYPEHCPICNVCDVCEEQEEHRLCAMHQAEAKEAAAERRWEARTGR
jgi:hypothetical protein